MKAKKKGNGRWMIIPLALVAVSMVWIFLGLFDVMGVHLTAEVLYKSA